MVSRLTVLHGIGRFRESLFSAKRFAESTQALQQAAVPASATAQPALPLRGLPRDRDGDRNTNPTANRWRLLWISRWQVADPTREGNQVALLAWRDTGDGRGKPRQIEVPAKVPSGIGYEEANRPHPRRG